MFTRHFSYQYQYKYTSRPQCSIEYTQIDTVNGIKNANMTNLKAKQKHRENNKYMYTVHSAFYTNQYYDYAKVSICFSLRTLLSGGGYKLRKQIDAILRLWLTMNLG